MSEMSSSRIEAFDSLRGLAACTVVFAHLIQVLQGQTDRLYATFFDWTQIAVFTPLYVLWQSQAAVVLFFTLSGFVLYLLLDKARRPMAGYAVKRLVRLYVPYAAAVMVGLVGAYGVAGETLSGFNEWISKFWSWPVTWQAVAEHAAFLGQFNADRYDFTIWTLVHEMRISLLFPLIFWWVRGRPWWGALLPFVLASVAMALIGQPAVQAHVAWVDALTGWVDRGGLTAYVLTVHYLLPFAIGATLAHHRQVLLPAYRRLAPRTRVLLGVLAFLLYVHGSQAMHVFGLTTLMPYDWPLMLGAALLLIAAAAEPGLRRRLEHPALCYLGRISYSLYLFHPLVLLAMLHLFAHRVPLVILLPIILLMMFAVAELAYRTLERPAIRLSARAGDRVAGIQQRLMRSRLSAPAAVDNGADYEPGAGMR